MQKRGLDQKKEKKEKYRKKKKSKKREKELYRLPKKMIIVPTLDFQYTWEWIFLSYKSQLSSLHPRSTNHIVWAFLRANPTLLRVVTNRVLTLINREKVCCQSIWLPNNFGIFIGDYIQRFPKLKRRSKSKALYFMLFFGGGGVGPNQKDLFWDTLRTKRIHFTDCGRRKKTDPDPLHFPLKWRGSSSRWGFVWKLSRAKNVPHHLKCKHHT